MSCSDVGRAIRRNSNIDYLLSIGMMIGKILVRQHLQGGN